MSNVAASREGSQSGLAILLRGAIAALFGVYILIYPANTLVVIAQLAALFFLVEGIVRIIGVLIGRRSEGRLYNTVLGIVGIVTGLVVWGLPIVGIELTTFLINFAIIAIGLQSLLSGVLLVLSAGRRERGQGIYRLGGIAIIVFGLILLSVPFLGMSPVLARVLGVVGLGYGLVLIYAGLQVNAA